MAHPRQAVRRFISIHAPQWGATAHHGHAHGPRVISIHAPQWGATRYRLRWVRHTLYFNPRTPVGCDDGPFAVIGLDGISIHAPQWGATRGRRSWCFRHMISIHAPQWGATGDNPTGGNNPGVFQSTHPSGVRRCSPMAVFCAAKFQSTHPSGVRLDFDSGTESVPLFQSTHPSGVRRFPLGRGEHCRQISIHAPQWGATCCSRVERRRTTHFNPRTPVGCDFWTRLMASTTSEFQSTHPSGVRPTCTITITESSNFNPRTPVGCDEIKITITIFKFKFQSTHPSGVRRA